MVRLHRVAPDEPEIAAVLDRHFALMRSQTPAESCHVLPADALATPDIHLFALRGPDEVVAVGALRVFGKSAELKSMHTVSERRGQGCGRRLLKEVMNEARRMGLEALFLETGTGPEHSAARALYLSEGFAECAPFGTYQADPLSVFMSRAL